MDIELCAGSFEEALLAQQFRLKRIELCSALELGGLTPSAGLIKQCIRIPEAETHVMIRPRAGSFVYSKEELNIIMNDIRTSSEAGAHGVVFGILTEDHEPDFNSLRLLSVEAKSLGLEITFHRAFDLTSDPLKALEQLVELQFDRILTSGQQAKAADGIGLIRELVVKAKGRMQIMAGSGIHADNVKLFDEAQVDAIHFTSRFQRTSHTRFEMGEQYVPDPEKVRSIVTKLKVPG